MTIVKEILQGALDILKDDEFCAKYPFVRETITEEIIAEIGQMCEVRDEKIC